jgi:phage I-like protein
MNADGTFKGGFDGCVLHMRTCEGHSEESARRICGAIAQRVRNRDFEHPADGWYQIEAKGEHPNRRAGVIQVIDEAACRAIVKQFNAEAAEPDFAGMLIDHEHFKHEADKETVAYGWLERLQARADGIYGQIRWSETGRKAVDGGDYRFFSTEYDAGEVEILNAGESPKRARPLRLDGLTLTNANNNKGQKPITNRGVEAAEKEPQMKSVCTLLGLTADASEEAVQAEVARLLNRVKELEGSQIESDLETYKNRYDPKQREFVRTLLVTNRAATVEFLKSQPEGKSPLAPARLHNRQSAQPVDAAAGGEAADEAALSAERSAAIETYRVTNRCTYQQAHDAVRRRKPGLFGLPPRA